MTESNNYHLKFVNGAIGAIFNSIAGHPFDTIRVIQQDIKSKRLSSINVAKNILKVDGLKGLFRGFIPSTLGLMTETSTVFATNDILRELYIKKYDSKPNSFEDIVIGGISGLSASFISCPFETIKCNLQVNTPLSSYSFTKLYSGFWSICLRNIPLYSCFIPIYNLSISSIQNIQNKKYSELSLLDHATAGGITGVLSWTIIYPFDVIKCNQQISVNKLSLIDTASNMIKQRGIGSLYSGINTTIVRAFPANFALLFGVELGRRITNT
jgi:hypothetical protein